MVGRCEVGGRRCSKSRHIPPSKRIGGCACAPSSAPTHHSGVWGSTSHPPFKGGLCWHRRLGYCAAARIKNSRLSLSTARLGYRAVARTALPLKQRWPKALLLKRCCRTMLDRGWVTALSRERRCHSNGKSTKLRFAKPNQAALGHAGNRWAEGVPGLPRCRANGFAIQTAPAKGVPTMLPH